MARFAQQARDTDGNLVILRKCTKCHELAIESVGHDLVTVLFKSLSGERTITKQINIGKSWCRTCHNKQQREKWKNDPEWREKTKSSSKNWQKNNREKINQQRKDKYQNDPEWREKIKQQQRDYNFKAKIKAMEKLGGLFCVGFDGPCRWNITDIDFLEFDHIHDDGVDDRKKGLIGPPLYRHIVLDLSVKEARNKYQVLCVFCNRKKENERRRRKLGGTKKGDRSQSEIERFKLLVESMDKDEISFLLNYVNQKELAYSRKFRPSHAMGH